MVGDKEIWFSEPSQDSGLDIYFVLIPFDKSWNHLDSSWNPLDL